MSKKERKMRRNLSYIFLAINMIIAILIPSNPVSNILIFGTAIQTFSITKIAYKLTKNEYGYKVYLQESI